MRLLAAALVTVLAPLAIAQGNVPAHAGRRASRGHHAAASPLSSFLTPFLGDAFSPDDLSPGGDPSQAPSFLLDATRALSGPGGFPGQPDTRHESSSSSSSEPLLIELQGDRYVRISSAAIDGEARPLPGPQSNFRVGNGQPSKAGGGHSKPLAQNAAAGSGPMIAAGPAAAARVLPAAILIFRDGHSEEVHDYTIADGFLYARGDFYTDGYWNKKIDLAALDLAATMQTNSARNVKFVIPSSPNEVITRP
jgi:hypothetical protein